MKILVLHQHYWPEIAPTGQLLQDICEDLVSSGHSVTVVCGQPSYRILDGMPRTLPPIDTYRGVKILRVRSYIPEERTIPRRIVHYASYFLTSLQASIALERPDVALIMSSPPLLLGLSGAILTALRDIPFVYSVQDIYPDVAINLGVVRNRLVLKLLNEISARLYKSAARIVTLSPSMAESLLEKGALQERVDVIPNWADTTNLTPLARDNAFAKAHHLCGSFVVQYSGNVGMSQGLEHLIAAAPLVRDLPVTILVAGDGNAKAQLERTCADHGYDNVRFLPPQPRNNLSALLASSDLGLVSMKRGVGRDLVPSKLYGIMAAGKPVLAAVENQSEVARVIGLFGCGHIVDPESSTALAAGIRKLFLEREQLAQKGEAGRLACEQHYCRSACTKMYADSIAMASRLSSDAEKSVSSFSLESRVAR